MKFSVKLTLPLFGLIGFLYTSCADTPSTSPATPLPANETLSQYMNPSGYAYPVVDRVCDHSP